MSRKHNRNRNRNRTDDHADAGQIEPAADRAGDHAAHKYTIAPRPTTLTPAQQSEYNAIIKAALDNASDAERDKIDRRLKRITDRFAESVKLSEGGGGCATDSRLCTLAGVTPAAVAALIAYSGGAHVRRALASAGLDMSRDWGIITRACNDPRFALAWMAARSATGQRIADRALGVVEAALDGAGEVDGNRARLATWALERMGGYTDPSRVLHTQDQRAPATAAAQVVINLGGDKDLSICGGLLQQGRGGVING